ncbi:hypothetical protein U9M48_012332 [Paspalum notatum var. saurae]|uniref:Uncharacterized protein n=1 Tax=Paspalum notatum var. saurae TaxID=547442 RepID=A0AAQ3WHZ5_PASNO
MKPPPGPHAASDRPPLRRRAPAPWDAATGAMLRRAPLPRGLPRHQPRAGSVCPPPADALHGRHRHQPGLGMQQMDRDVPAAGDTTAPNVANKMDSDHRGAHNIQQNSRMTVRLQSMLKVREQEALDKHTKMEPQPIGAQQLITISQENSSHCTAPQTSATMGNAREVDWRDEMFEEKAMLTGQTVEEPS